MIPADSGGGVREGRRSRRPVRVYQLERRELARARTKGYNRQEYDGYQKQDQEQL